MPSEIKQLRPAPLPTTNTNGRASGAENATANNRNTGAPTGTAGTKSADTVTVTGEATRLQEMEQSLSSSPVVDSEKVARIKQALADGNYQPNPEAIADKMIELEQDLL